MNWLNQLCLIIFIYGSKVYRLKMVSCQHTVKSHTQAHAKSEAISDSNQIICSAISQPWCESDFQLTGIYCSKESSPLNIVFPWIKRDASKLHYIYIGEQKYLLLLIKPLWTSVKYEFIYMENMAEGKSTIYMLCFFLLFSHNNY